MKEFIENPKLIWNYSKIDTQIRVIENKDMYNVHVHVYRIKDKMTLS